MSQSNDPKTIDEVIGDMKKIFSPFIDEKTLRKWMENVDLKKDVRFRYNK